MPRQKVEAKESRQIDAVISDGDIAPVARRIFFERGQIPGKEEELVCWYAARMEIAERRSEENRKKSEKNQQPLYSRKEFIYSTAALGVIGTIFTVSGITWKGLCDDREADIRRRLLEENSKRDAATAYRKQLLHELFGHSPHPEQCGVNAIAAANHKNFGKLTVDPIDGDTAQAYIDSFANNDFARTFTETSSQRYGVALIGSQVSNVASRAYMGSLSNSGPVHKIIHPHTQKPINYHWNLWSGGDDGVISVVQHGRVWNSRDGRIVSPGDESGLKPNHVKNVAKPGTWRWDRDYLLVTVLPRYENGEQRTVIFSGLHGAGTVGARLLFTEEAIDALEKHARRSDM